MKSLTRVENFPSGTCSSISTLHIYVSSSVSPLCIKGWNRKRARWLAGWLKINSSSRFCAQINFSPSWLHLASASQNSSRFLMFVPIFCVRRCDAKQYYANANAAPYPHTRRRSRRLAEKPYIHSLPCVHSRRPLKKHPFFSISFCLFLTCADFFSIFLGVNTPVLLRWVFAQHVRRCYGQTMTFVRWDLQKGARAYITFWET